MEAPGGRCFAEGDWIVTLAPGAQGRLVTSERGVVVATRAEDRYLIARMDDGRFERFSGEELGPDRLGHAYATTVHRSQGATVDMSHRLEDGGGRELAYVALSRARESSTVWVVADSLDQAREDLVRDWSDERRPRWAIDTGVVADEGQALEYQRRRSVSVDDALRRARLEAEARAVMAAGPPDLRPQLQEVERQLRRLDQVEEDLEYGRGVWEGTEVAEAYRQMTGAQADHYQANRRSRDPNEGFLSRRRWRREAEELAPRREAAEARFGALVERESKVLGRERKELEATKEELEAGIDRREEWLSQHPEVGLRLEAIGKELTDLGLRRSVDPTLDRALGLDHLDRLAVREPPTLDQGLGMDLGL